MQGEPFKKSIKVDKTVVEEDFKNYTKNDKEKIVSAIYRKIKRDHLCVPRGILRKVFK